MKTEIFLKSGFLSWYGFICGYVQMYDKNPKFELKMYKEGACNVYQLQQVTISEYSRSVDVWLTFDNLTDCKKQYNKLLTQIKIK